MASPYYRQGSYIPYNVPVYPGPPCPRNRVSTKPWNVNCALCYFRLFRHKIMTLMTAFPLLLGPGSYKSMCDDLRNHFRERDHQEQRRCTISMVGILFARPNSAFAQTEITPNYRYFHFRSGNLINFYCAGFDPIWDIPVLKDADNADFFSISNFVDFVGEIQRRSRWRYTGGADLLLCNALRGDDDDVGLDFSTAIVADLVRMKAEGAILSVESFFEKIVQHVEAQSGDDPTWGFSDSQGIAVAKSALKNVVMSLLPKSVQDDSKKAFHYIASDLSV